MLKTMVAVVAACLVTACGEEPPSCQQAVTHYYEAGCVLLNLQTNAPFTKNEVIADCKGLLATAPSSTCEIALEDLRFCWDGVRSPAATNADCDCSQEQDAVLTCD